MAVVGRLPQGATRKPVPIAAWALTGVAVAAIWVGVVLAGIVAPDFVSGSQQEHLPLVAWGDWIWGAVATCFVVLAAVKGIKAAAASLTPWVAMGAGIALVWTGVVLVTAYAPVFVTGTDPTRIPLAAMGAPILGTFLTWFVCTLVKAAFEEHAA